MAPGRNDAEAGERLSDVVAIHHDTRGPRLSRGGVFFRAYPPSPRSATMRAGGRPAPVSPSPAAKRTR